MPLPGDIELHLVNTIDEAAAMKRWLGERREVLALDTETSGLDPLADGAKLRLVQIGDHRAGWSVPWEQWGGAVMECLDAYEGEITAHNLSFDEKWMRVHAGWQAPWHRLHDTMIMSQMLLPGQPAGLKPLSNRFVDRRASAGEAMLKQAMGEQGWGWENIPVDFGPYWQYAALDVIITSHLWSHFRADQKYPESYDLEMATRRICSKMEENGVPIDIEYCERKRDELEAYVQSSKRWAQENYGLNIGSSAQLIKHFQNTLNATITRTTASGAPSLDKDQLQLFTASDDSRVSGLAQFVLDVRKADKLRGTYFDNFLKMHTDGIVHPSIRTLQAITGRMSIVDPALQTLGKNDSTVRGAFVARPDEALLTSDLDQVEFRMFAHLSGDDKLCETFRRADETGSDAFTEIGRQIYRDPDMQKSDKRRNLVKGVIYGRLYGASVKKQAATAGVPYDQMKAVSDALESNYPGIAEFQRGTDHLVMSRIRNEGGGYIETAVTGRRIPVDEEKPYTGVNYTIQASAAEVFKRNLVKLDAAGLTDMLMVPVHDEIVLSAPQDQVDEVREVVRDCMTTTEGWRVPLTAGVDGPYPNWGTKYEPKDAA